MESLFGGGHGGAFQDDNPLLATKEKERNKAEKKRKKGKAGKKKSSSKTFTADLDALFEEAMRETIEEKQEEQRAVKASKTQKRSSRKKQLRRPVSGLDALIRRTIETSTMEFGESIKKRVTFVFDKHKLDRLKKIAKVEKSYLKDIIGDVVSEFIDKYEKEQDGIEKS